MSVRINISSTGDRENPKHWAWPRHAERNRDEPTCICPFVDVGVGIMQHGVDPDCPACNDLNVMECTCAPLAEGVNYRWRPGGSVVLLHPLAPLFFGLGGAPGAETDPCCPIHGE